jgi:Leucine-rich repeat (LRR) protein
MNQRNLVVRPESAVVAAGNDSGSVLGRMTGSALAVAREKSALATVRHRIGDYEFRDPDYRQIQLWANALSLVPEEVVRRLEATRLEDSWHSGLATIEFEVNDGVIVSLALDLDQLPLKSIFWTNGLLIRRLGIYDCRTQNVSLELNLGELNTLWCASIGLSSLDLSRAPKVTELICHLNRLSELDLSPVPDITRLGCGCNLLTKLDLSPAKKLVYLDCHDNELTALCCASSPMLREIVCYSNQLAKLDIPLSPELQKLDCACNNLKSINLLRMPKLTDLDCSANELSALDLSSVNELLDLDCRCNELTELDLSHVPKLKSLDCSHNKLAVLEIPLVPYLRRLICDLGHLRELDLSFHSKESLDVRYPDLTKVIWPSD